MGRTRDSNRSELPALYLIADVDTAARLQVDLVEVIREFVGSGGRMVSLRPGDADDRELLRIGRLISGLIFSVGGIFLVHRRVDLARLVGADGVHLPSRGFDSREISQLLPPSTVLGRSCHDRREIERADKNDFNFATLGPLFESVSKPGYGPKFGSSEFENIADATGIPIFALGGVVPQKVARCFELGARGVAVVGGIVGAESPGEATRGYLKAIEAAQQNITKK